MDVRNVCDNAVEESLLGCKVYEMEVMRDVICHKLSVLIFFIRDAVSAGFTIEEIFNLTMIDRWFLAQIKEILDFEEELAGELC